MDLTITLPNGITLGFMQAMVLRDLIAKYGRDDISWHPNDCGCCVTLHAPDYDYIIDTEGGYDRLTKSGMIAP